MSRHNCAIINKRQLFQKTSFISRQLNINAETNNVIAMIKREKGAPGARSGAHLYARGPVELPARVAWSATPSGGARTRLSREARAAPEIQIKIRRES